MAISRQSKALFSSHFTWLTLRQKSIFNRLLTCISCSTLTISTAYANEIRSDQLADSGVTDSISLELFGRVQTDYSHFNGGPETSFNDDIELRRAQLGLKGTVSKRFKFKSEISVDPDLNVDVQDLYISWAPEGAEYSVSIGHLKTPNSLDEQTSSRFTSTLERSAFTDAFGFDRGLGATLNYKSKNFGIAGGIYGNNVNDGIGNRGWSLASRAYYKIDAGSFGDLHIGASVLIASEALNSRCCAAKAGFLRKRVG